MRFPDASFRQDRFACRQFQVQEMWREVELMTEPIWVILGLLMLASIPYWLYRIFDFVRVALVVTRGDMTMQGHIQDVILFGLGDDE